MPRDVTRNCSNGIAFAVGDHVANDALLGPGRLRGRAPGHRADPRHRQGNRGGQGLHRRTLRDRAGLLPRRRPRENDQVTPIIDRAMAAIAERGALPGGPDPARQIEPARDLLDDLDAVLGDEPVPAADVPALLKRTHPAWTPYQRLTGKASATAPPNTGSRCPPPATAGPSTRSPSVKFSPNGQPPTSTTRSSRRSCELGRAPTPEHPDSGAATGPRRTGLTRLTS